jgi:collagenase-like PrtC family protease
MKLSLASNYDPDLVAKLKGYPVAEIFGKLPYDLVGGGRPSYMGTPFSYRQLAEYVSFVQSNGMAFNYLLNSACMGNREWGRRWQKKFNKFLEKLSAAGVSRMTVATPFLLELVKKRFPHFFIKVGIFAQVDTPRRAKFWEDLGADAITLESFSINRDFTALRAIRKAMKCELQLIVNHPCLPNCPMQFYHQNGFAHSSNGSRNFFLDYCSLKCARRRLQEPSLFIKSAWIRPEDIGYYEKMGYDSFKLLERGIPSAEMLKRVDAYSKGSFAGNLAELILPYGFRQPVRKERFWLLRNFFRPFQVSPAKLKSFYDLIKRQGMLFELNHQPVKIDSSGIPKDFIEGFENRNCAMLDCSRCGYCERIADDAVRIDSVFQRELLKQFGEVEDMMVSGGLWDV